MDQKAQAVSALGYNESQTTDAGLRNLVLRRHLQLSFCVRDHVPERQVPHVLHCPYAGLGGCRRNLRSKRHKSSRRDITDRRLSSQYDLWSSIKSPVSVFSQAARMQPDPLLSSTP